MSEPTKERSFWRHAALNMVQRLDGVQVLAPGHVVIDSSSLENL